MSDGASLPDREDGAAGVTAEPTLYVVATPIGNLRDISLRALDVLRTVEVIACEDTRRTRKLLTHFEITGKRLIACHDHNERNSASGIVKLLGEGKHVALCSDGGTPLLNDPGFRVVAAVREAGFAVTAIPGASAVSTALVLSGLPPDRFLFVGFPPRKPGRRRKWLAEVGSHACTIVALESPHRLPAFLADALEVLGDLDAAVCLELTKRFEDVTTGPLSELAEIYAEPPRGEVTVVIDANPPPKPTPTPGLPPLP
jgi:16S rRNA (cytidine1402-2'-O)-methyltransferase